LKEFWKETPLWGKHPIRKWERKFILSIDYGLEALYAWVLEKGFASDLWSRECRYLYMDSRTLPKLCSRNFHESRQ